MARATRIEGISSPHGSSLTLALNNGVSKRVNLRLSVSDSLVVSIFEVFKAVLPQRLYETLNQDFLDFLVKCNVEQTQRPHSKNELVTGD